MIDFSQVTSPVRIDKQFIMSKLDETQIFRYYFGHFNLRDAYCSKFRKDRSPSTGFYIAKSGAIIYNDFTTGEKLDCINFVAKLYNISFYQALTKIACDFGLVENKIATPLAQKVLEQTVEFDKEYKKETIIQIIPDVWQSHHIKYWNDYTISVDELKREEVYPVKRLFINKSEWKSLEQLCFAYVVRDKISKVEYLKIYQPEKKGNGKWISNVPLTIPFGLDKLKYGTEHILVGKAQKCRIILLKLFQSVIGTQNESESALNDDLVKHLTFNFPKRTIIWDSDEAGVENCKKFNSKGFGYFNIPNEFLPYDIKDVSDYVKAFGLNALTKLLKEKNIL